MFFKVNGIPVNLLMKTASAIPIEDFPLPAILKIVSGRTLDFYSDVFPVSHFLLYRPD